MIDKDTTSSHYTIIIGENQYFHKRGFCFGEAVRSGTKYLGLCYFLNCFIKAFNNIDRLNEYSSLSKRRYLI